MSVQRSMSTERIYKATILRQNITKEYIRSTGVSFKTRYNQPYSA